MDPTTKKITMLLLVMALLAPCAVPKAEAMDPVTIAILAPLAIKGELLQLQLVTISLLSLSWVVMLALLIFMHM